MLNKVGKESLKYPGQIADFCGLVPRSRPVSTKESRKNYIDNGTVMLSSINQTSNVSSSII